MVGDTNFPPPYKRLSVNFCNFAELHLPSLRSNTFKLGRLTGRLATSRPLISS